MTVNKIDKILARNTSPGGILQKLLRTGQERAYLTRIFKHYFPENLSDGIKNVKKSGTVLHVECLNSSIATTVRFESDNLNKALSCLSDFGKIDEIRPFVGNSSNSSSDS